MCILYFKALIDHFANSMKRGKKREYDSLFILSLEDNLSDTVEKANDFYPTFPDKTSNFDRETLGSKITISKDTSHLWSRTDIVDKSLQYPCEILQFLRHTEIINQPIKKYMSLNQKELNETMRGTLVDWMIAVAEQFKLRNETVMLSIRYVDKFLSNIYNQNIDNAKIQLIGVVSLLISSKIEEIIPPRIEDLLYITDNSYEKEDVLSTEWYVLDSLSYETIQPTSVTFLPRILFGNNLSIRYKDELRISVLCSFLVELAAMDYKVSTSYLPSLIASSCVLLANFLLFIDKPSWTKKLQRLSGNYRSSHLVKCGTLIYKLLYESMYNTSYNSSVRRKYTNSKFWNLSLHKDISRSLHAFETPPSFIFADIT